MKIDSWVYKQYIEMRLKIFGKELLNKGEENEEETTGNDQECDSSKQEH